jgi:eukaryotic-like serine/threonine-protein kinase
MSPLAPSEARWYYARDNKKVGPLTWKQLRHLAATGLLTPSDMLLRDGESEWQPANKLPDLFRSRTIGETKNFAEKPAVTVPPPNTRVTGCPPGAAANRVERETPTAFPQVPGYQVLGELGRGGMGVVYKARQTKPNRLVALKMILASGEASEAQLTRFDLEARALARLKHPNIVQLYEVGEYQGQPFFSLELVEGGSLAQRLDGKTLPPEQAAQLVETLARAMFAAHRCGIIHRDLKPSNVLVAADGSLKVTDFGLAKDLRDVSGPTATGAVMGTPAYMAPEQAAGQTDQFGPHTDVYALGAILYEALCGHPPFSGTPQIILFNVLEREPVPPRRANRKIPVDLETICLKCLQKDPRQRYRSAGELAEELRRFRKEEPIQARPLGRGERLIRWARRRPALAAVYGLLLVVAGLGSLGVGALLLWQKAEEARVAAESERQEAVEARAQLDTEKQRTEAALQREQRARTVSDQAKQEAINASQAAELARQKAVEARAQIDKEKQRTESALQREQQTLQRLAQVSYLHHVELALLNWHSNEVAQADKLLDDCPRDLRGWEWFYVKRLCHSEKLSLKGHIGTVSSVAFSADGKRIVSGSYDRTVKVWDAQTGQEKLTLKGHTRAVSSVAFSADGKRVVSGSWGRDEQGKLLPGEVKVWDAQTRQEVLTLQGHTYPANSVAYSADGKRIVSGGRGFDQKTGEVWGELKVWDAQTGQEALTLKGHTSEVTSVAFSADGRRIVSGSDDQTVKVWDRRQEEFTLKGHAAKVTSVCFSPDGKHIVSGSDDRTVKVWNVQTGQEAFTLKGHTDKVTSVAFSADGKCIVSGSGDQTVKVWDAQTGQQALTLKGHTQEVRSVAFSADDKRLASGSLDQTVKVWDAHTGQETLTFKGHTHWVNSVAFSADGKRIVSASEDQTVKVWDAHTGKEQLTLQGASEPVAFSPDSTVIVSGSRHQTVKVWNAHTGKEQLTDPLKGVSGSLVAFSPDGKRIASGSGDRTVKVWDAQTGQRTLTLKGASSPVAFSPDGKRLVSGSANKILKVWDAQTGEEVLTLKGHTSDVMSVVFSIDGKRIASGSGDNMVKVWDAQTGQEALTLKGHTEAVTSVAFSADGKRLVSGSHDKTVKVWDATPVETEKQRGK